MYVKVEVLAGRRKEKVTLVKDKHFSMTVREPAERNLANGRIRQILSEWYDVGVGRVRLISGHRSPKKVFDIDL